MNLITEIFFQPIDSLIQVQTVLSILYICVLFHHIRRSSTKIRREVVNFKELCKYDAKSEAASLKTIFMYNHYHNEISTPKYSICRVRSNLVSSNIPECTSCIKKFQDENSNQISSTDLSIGTRYALNVSEIINELSLPSESTVRK